MQYIKILFALAVAIYIGFEEDKKKLLKIGKKSGCVAKF